MAQVSAVGVDGAGRAAIKNNFSIGTEPTEHVLFSLDPDVAETIHFPFYDQGVVTNQGS